MSSTNNTPNPLVQPDASSSHATPSRSHKTTSKQTTRSPRPPSDNDYEGDFTPLMQDAQARGKDPFAASGRGSKGKGRERGFWDGSEDEGEEDERFDAFGFDNYERTQQRRAAALILDNHELIMMHALARGDSIPATRHYFRKMMCGYIDVNEMYQKPGITKDDDVLREKEKERGGKGSARRSRKSGGVES